MNLATCIKFSVQSSFLRQIEPMEKVICIFLHIQIWFLWKVISANKTGHRKQSHDMWSTYTKFYCCGFLDPPVEVTKQTRGHTNTSPQTWCWHGVLLWKFAKALKIDRRPTNLLETSRCIATMFSDSSTNISVAVHIVIDRILTQNEFEVYCWIRQWMYVRKWFYDISSETSKWRMTVCWNMIAIRITRSWSENTVPLRIKHQVLIIPMIHGRVNEEEGLFPAKF